MAAVARQMMEMSMNQQATALEKDVEYIKTDITGMKLDIRRLNDKTDGIIASVSAVREELKESIGSVRAEIGAVREEMKESNGALRAEIGDLRTEMEKSIGSVRVEIGFVRTEMEKSNGALRAQIGAVHAELKELITSKINWAIFLYVTLAGILLLVMARGFEWL